MKLLSHRSLVFTFFGITSSLAVFGDAQLTWAKSHPHTGAQAQKAAPSKSPGEKSAEWRNQMQNLYKILVELTTDTSSDRRFNAPENRARIERNTQQLSEGAHHLMLPESSPDQDPTVRILSDRFQAESQRAFSALKSGNRAYARGILNQISSYCIACHTRNQSGPSFAVLPLEPLSKGLTPIEQGRFLAATRQYDRALDLFQKIVNDPQGPVQSPLEWEQALRYGLSIAVRVKKDPEAAQALVERVLGAKNAPFFLKQDATQWKASILKWKEEIPKRALTEEGLYTEAVGLLAQASQAQKYPMDHGADVLYLRASAVIHELLQTAPEGRKTPEALLMAGMCYDVLRPLNMEDIHEVYYEACIKKSPHTALSETCYRRYEQSTYAGYTGSGGFFLPEDVKEKLRTLEALAHPPEVIPPAQNPLN